MKALILVMTYAIFLIGQKVMYQPKKLICVTRNIHVKYQSSILYFFFKVRIFQSALQHRCETLNNPHWSMAMSVVCGSIYVNSGFTSLNIALRQEHVWFAFTLFIITKVRPQNVLDYNIRVKQYKITISGLIHHTECRTQVKITGNADVSIWLEYSQ